MTGRAAAPVLGGAALRLRRRQHLHGAIRGDDRPDAGGAGGVAHTLTHQMSADGARYADKRLEVWGKGRGARVTDLTTGAAVQCEER